NEHIANHSRLTGLFEVKPRYLSENIFGDTYLKEFPKEDYDHLLVLDDKLVEAKRENRFEDLLKTGQATYSSIFLNFNYTSTLSAYIEILKDIYYDKINQIPIHGSLKDNSNINFGFGDEMDDDYKKMENFDENEYLRNFKSFHYTQNSNYKNLLDYISSDKFQVYIMGHPVVFLIVLF
ncbi:MAG: AbiH family protein, partial [Bacteroidota bacterium]